MENFLSFKTNYKHCSQDYYIRKLDPSQDMSRSALFAREVRAAEGVDNWKAIQASLSDIRIEEEAAVFTGMQVHYDDEIASILVKVEEDIREQCGLKVIQRQYLLQLLQAQYLETLKREKITLKAKNMVDEVDVGLPEMTAIFVEMMLKEKDSPYLVQIRKILLEWRNR